MKLYLLRHGKAARSDPDQPRSLTSKGKAEVALVAGYFKKKNLKINSLWHSPKTRALETAEIFLKITGESGVKVEEKKGLKPEGDALEVYREISTHPDGSLLVVSHLPFIEELASLFAVDSPGAEIAFPTAGLAAFENKGNNWQWLWSLDPSTLK
jgi:phosphohistidine phosphatase